MTDRVWTDVEGRTLEARLLRVGEDFIVVQRGGDGRVFPIPMERLSVQDREFVSDWEPPDLLVPTIEEAVFVVSAGRRSGTGFLVQESGQSYLYTNQHVIAGVRKEDLHFENAEGLLLEPGPLEILNDADLARILVESPYGLKLSGGARINADIVAYGNSEGTGVLTINKGKIVGLSSDRLEVDAAIVPGNSGGPIVDEEGEVVGVATYLQLMTAGKNWMTQGTRYGGVRRFGLRLTSAMEWQPVTWEEYFIQAEAAEKIVGLMEDFFNTMVAMIRNPSVNLREEDFRDHALSSIVRDHNQEARRVEQRARRSPRRGLNMSSLEEMNRYENVRIEERVRRYTAEFKRHLDHRIRIQPVAVDIPWFKKRIEDSMQAVRDWDNALDEIFAHDRQYLVMRGFHVTMPPPPPPETERSESRRDSPQ